MFTAKTLIDDKVAGFEAGADDYLTKPTHPAELASRVKSILQRNATQRRKEVSKGTAIGVLGTKGGVGTTTITLNVGAALKAAGENPIVADFRLGVGSLGLLMGMGRSSGMATILSRPVTEIRPNTIEREIVAHSSGLRALLSSARPREATLNFPTEAAVAVTRGLRTLGKPVIVDMGSGYNTLINRVQLEMDKIIVVLEPTPVNLTMARDLILELESEQKGRTHVVVVNRTTNATHAPVPWQDVEKLLGQEIRAIIAAAPDVTFGAMEKGMPIVQYQPNAIISSQLVKLAEDLNASVHSPA